MLLYYATSCGYIITGDPKRQNLDTKYLNIKFSSVQLKCVGDVFSLFQGTLELLVNRS